MIASLTMTRRLGNIFRWVLIYLVVGLLALAFALPFIWLVSGSLKTDRQLFSLPPIWLPSPMQWGNYPAALRFIPYFLYVRNTLTICVGTVVGALLSCTLAAYGFSRIQWTGRDTIFMIVISTMMLPYSVVMVPLFIVFRRLDWIGTYLPLIVPSFFGSAFFIFMLRQFFMTIPLELSDAARIDGANEIQIMLRVILPLARPALAMVALFQFMGAWGDYLGPLIYINKESMYTVALGLTMFLDQHAQEWALLMAASTVTLAPIIALFFFTQRTFIEGISMTGLKG
jgi:ABC-type glycerol-3-phosphate transport system permease component